MDNTATKSDVGGLHDAMHHLYAKKRDGCDFADGFLAQFWLASHCIPACPNQPKMLEEGRGCLAVGGHG